MLNNASERGIYVLAATNHPERIDRAVLRTRLIDEMVYVDMAEIEETMANDSSDDDIAESAEEIVAEEIADDKDNE